MHLKRIPGASLGKTSTLRCELGGSRARFGDERFRLPPLPGADRKSPLQVQKQLRLQEARRLMHGEGLDAASARYWVGYDDAS
jgi:AraC-like DNA-binding protein